MSENVVSLQTVQDKWLEKTQERLLELHEGLKTGDYETVITIAIPHSFTRPDIDLFGENPCPLPHLVGYLETTKLDVIAFYRMQDDE